MAMKKRILTVMVLTVLITIACTMPFGLSLVNPTLVAKTFAAGLTETLQAGPVQNTTVIEQATASSVAIITTTPTATITAMPTLTTTLTPPITATISPSPTQTAIGIPCNRAAYVADVTYPDNTAIEKDTAFVKTWRLKNTGSCTWTSGYKLVFSDGDRMDAPDEVILTGVSIPPGGTVDASVNLKSPSSAGTYRGNFKLKSPDSQIFGISADASGSFYVIIQVVIPAPGVTLKPFFPPMIPLKITGYNPSYIDSQNCFGSSIFHFFKIENTGGTDLESWRMNLTDNTTSSGHGIYSNDGFTTSSSCISVLLPRIETGNSGYIGVKEYSDITGHNMTATFKICTGDGLGGVCVDKSVTFVAE